MNTGTAGEYGRRSPSGLCDLPCCRSLYDVGGAKSILPISANESSLSFEGVGRVVKAAGGCIGFLGPERPIRPDADEFGLGAGGMNRPDADDCALGPGGIIGLPNSPIDPWKARGGTPINRCD